MGQALAMLVVALDCSSPKLMGWHFEVGPALWLELLLLTIPPNRIEARLCVGRVSCSRVRKIWLSAVCLLNQHLGQCRIRTHCSLIIKASNDFLLFFSCIHYIHEGI